MPLRVFLLLCLFFVSCRTTVTEDKVSYEQGVMVLKSSRKPFTGDVISTFENSSKISNKVSYQDGIAKGNWFSKGYYGEIIHEGVYIDCDPDLSAFIKKETGSDLCSLSLWVEDDNTLATLDIQSSIILNDAAFALVYSKYLRKYNREYTEINIRNGDSILASRSYPQ